MVRSDFELIRKVSIDDTGCPYRTGLRSHPLNLNSFTRAEGCHMRWRTLC